MIIPLLFCIVEFGNLATAKWLWSSSPADVSGIEKTAYPLGNGRMGLLPAGCSGSESINVNLDSLCTGGPLEISRYSGENPPEDRSHILPGIREEIFQNGTGNVSALFSPISSYESYTPLAKLTVYIGGIDDPSSYFRGLDLTTGVHKVSFLSGGNQFNVSIFCSRPDDVCVYHLASKSIMPNIHFSLQNEYLNKSLVETTCTEGQLQFNGQLAHPGMKFLGIAQALQPSSIMCDGNSLALSSMSKSKTVTIVIRGGTSYEISHGNQKFRFSFRGDDPEPSLKKTFAAVIFKSYEEILARHITDYQRLFNTFSLDLPDSSNFSTITTADLILTYDPSNGNSFLESLLVDYGRYLLVEFCW
ncbi:uncharacterized protein N7477_000938 [Penicillium maclennaniae]|uniref:uncharacterized protein n=1 Tax=Penicillium maclennaniae TaxID=1343394 RepID=UPI0025400EB6|nr:uncharacterized protein N7477_000938 [Penicillium maclennaniae]KAJ5684593.1 hypothetical protein N7477_000938 [Penicillium maclennaniae]